MKQSYFVTPRSMNECVWLYDCDPIEKHEGTPDKHWIVVGAFFAVLLSGLVAVITV